MDPAERVALGKTGLKVTRMGMGTGPLGQIHDDAKWAEIFNAAWGSGIRTFDTSPYYGFGNSEKRLGKVLAGKNRTDYVLATKVGRLLRADAPVDPFAEAFYYPGGMPDNVLRTVYDYSGAAARQSLIESRERLGIDRIDIAHIHDIVELASGINHVDEAINEAYPALAELREKGEIKAVGVGAQVNSILIKLANSCAFDCFLIAGRYTMLDQSAVDEVMPLCLAKNIAVIIGSPYNTGILHDPKPGLDLRLRSGAAGADREGAEAEGHLREIQRPAACRGDPVSAGASGRGAGPDRRAQRFGAPGECASDEGRDSFRPLEGDARERADPSESAVAGRSLTARRSA